MEVDVDEMLEAVNGLDNPLLTIHALNSIVDALIDALKRKGVSDQGVAEIVAESIDYEMV